MNLSPRSVTGVTVIQTLALVPPVVTAGWVGTPGFVLTLLVAAISAVVWEMVFAGLRKRPFTAHGVTTALIVALYCPTDLPLWQLTVAVSMGVVFGELIFGGRGFGFVGPATLSLSLLIVAFPDASLRATTPDIALAVVPGVALLLAAGLLSLYVPIGVGLGALALIAFSGQPFEPVHIATALSVGVVFLIADPTASATTFVGRWVYGALAGAMIVVFSPVGTISPEAIVAAALLASVFAPLFDYGAILLHVRQRRRHG